jgi:hypothetical protein
MRTAAIITGPLHAHGARSPEEYLEKQRAHLAQLRAAYPQHGFGEPAVSALTALAWVSGGRWVVTCPCGNCPSADPEWRLAACFECGAVYRGVAFPAARQRIEALLLARPHRQNRHWLPQESVAALERENHAHGHEVPA